MAEKRDRGALMFDKPVLVTGGAGFIGSHLVEALANARERIVVFDNFTTGTKGNLAGASARVDVVEGDVRDLDSLRGVMEGVDVVFHLAAVSAVAPSVKDPLTTNAVNVTGTLNVLIAARDAGVRRVVFASSAAVYGSDPAVPTAETVPFAPLSPYAASKATGELYCRVFAKLYGVEAVALRLFNVYGPRQNPASEDSGVVTRFLSRLAGGQPPIIDGDGEQSRDLVYVGDVVGAFLRSCEASAASGEVFNIGSGRSTTINELAETLAGIAAPGQVLRPIHRPERVGDVRHSCADISKARQLLGYAPAVALADGLARTLAWWRESGQSP
jgi:UDP-glucose 4-epimerase